MKSKISIIGILIILIFTITGGCKKNKETIPVVTTSIVSNVTFKSAICGGNVVSYGYSTMLQNGVCWSTHSNPTIEDSIARGGWSTENYICNITGLAENTKYYVRAYATNDVGTAYGEEYSFSTTQIPEFFFKYNLYSNVYEPTTIEVYGVFDDIRIYTKTEHEYLIIDLPGEFTTGIHNLRYHGSYEGIFGIGGTRMFNSISGEINILEYDKETLKISAIFEFLGEDKFQGGQILITNGQFEVYY